MNHRLTRCTLALALLASLSGTAAAGDPPPLARSVAFDVTIPDAGKAPTRASLVATTGTCSELTTAAGDRRDRIEVCAEREDSNGVQVRLHWERSDGNIRYQLKSTAVVARGKSLQAGSAGPTGSIAVVVR